MPSPLAVAGVDGCRGGWVVATVTAAAVDLRWIPLDGLGSVIRDERLAAVAIDMPIGLPEVGPRGCDRLARARLPGRGSTVYPAPRRPVLGCTSYGEARALLARLGGPAMSAQAFGLVRSARALDAVMSPADEDRVVEAHPELAFAAMAMITAAGAGPLPSKSTPDGRARRMELLRAWRPDAAGALAAAGVPVVDGLDALACAWVAGRYATGAAEVLTDGERDAHGLLMRIVQ